MHQLRYGTNVNATGLPHLRSPSCISPEPVISQTKLRLVGDAASDASSRNSRNEPSQPQYHDPNEDVTSEVQRSSTSPSQYSVLPLPHDNVPVPLLTASMTYNIPDTLVPGRTPRLSTSLPPQAADVYSNKPLPQPALQPLSSVPHTRNTPRMPDPAWGYVSGSVASNFARNP